MNFGGPRHLTQPRGDHGRCIFPRIAGVALWCSALLVWLLTTSAAFGQTNSESLVDEEPRVEASERLLTPMPSGQPSRQSERISLESLTREELIEQGFVFQDSEESRSRARAIVMAATAGVAVHGIGHWYVGDQQTALVLMGMQGLGMGLLGTALGGYVWGGDSLWGSPNLISPLILVGSGLFVLSYFIDVVGTLYSDEMGLPNNTYRTRGLSVNTRYVYIKPEQTFLRHLLIGELRLDLGRFYFAPRTLQDVGLDLASYGLALGWRPWQGNLPMTHIFVEADTDFLTQRVPPEYARLDTTGLVGFSFDLGELSPHLEAMAVGMSIGLGQRFYRFSSSDEEGLDESAETRDEWTRASLQLPLEIFTHVNLSESFNLRVSMVRQRGNFLQTTQQRVAIPVFEITYRSTPRLDLVFRAEYGDGFALSGGLMMWAWE